MRFVITGTGRCGTRYVSTMLRRVGVNAGHEEVFGPDGFSGWGDLAGDVSWLAAPHLPLVETVIHLTRDEESVVRSYERLSFFVDPPPQRHLTYRRAIEQTVPEVFASPDETVRAQVFVSEWKRLIEPHAQATFDITEISQRDGFRSLLEVIR